MFGGKLIKSSRKTVEGSYRQEAYSDTWKDSIDIVYDGELTEAVCKAITEAFYNSSMRQQGQSLYGRLRARGTDWVSHVDTVKRQLIINCSESLCD